jgi:hypothetical protein
MSEKPAPVMGAGFFQRGAQHRQMTKKKVTP